MNGEPILFDDYHSLSQLHIDLLHSVPITSTVITEVERKLVNHPQTGRYTHLAMLTRAILIELLLYSFAPPDVKRRIRQAVRETYYDLPERWREPLREAL